MRVLISELLTEGKCEFSGKPGECVKVHLEPGATPTVVSMKELPKLLRFVSQQQTKRAAASETVRREPTARPAVDGSAEGPTP